MAADSTAAASLLKRQLREMQTSKDIPGISCGLVSDDNMLVWEVMLMISDDCKYYGGKFSMPFLLPCPGQYSTKHPVLDNVLVYACS
jgi:ubiquitin-protein ligase